MTTGTTTIIPSSQWQRLTDRLNQGIVLVIGKPGSGKTWLVSYLAEQLAAQGQKVGVLSAGMQNGRPGSSPL